LTEKWGRSIATIMESHANSAPHQPVVVGTHRHWNYIQLLATQEEFVRHLREISQPGDSVAVVSDDYLMTMVALSASVAASRTVAFVSPLLPSRVQLRQIQRLNPTAVIAKQGLIDGLNRVQPGFTFEVVSRTGGELEQYRTAMSHPKADASPNGRGKGDAKSLVVLFTSGTTGEPKMVVHDEHSLINAFLLIRAVACEVLAPALQQTLAEALVGPIGSEWFTVTRDSAISLRYLNCMPPTSIAGIGMALQAMLGGDSMSLTPSYDPADAIAMIGRLAITNLGVTPSFAQALVRAGRRIDGSTASLETIGVGGGIVPPRLCGNLEERFKCRVIAGYGATELGGVVASSRYLDDETIRWTTIGRAVPGVELRISATSELEVRSPAVGLGYLSEKGDVASFCDDEGWYLTGDKAVESENRSFKISGRIADTIMRSGAKIDPWDIEDLILSHSEVSEAAVVGIPSRISGEHDIVAFVVASSTVTPSLLRRLCLRELGPQFTPRKIAIVAELPSTNEGKIDRNAIRNAFINVAG